MLTSLLDQLIRAAHDHDHVIFELDHGVIVRQRARPSQRGCYFSFTRISVKPS
jgi:hypothetical protein